MELAQYFKSVLEQDVCAVVICDLDHKIVYMNPAAIQRYASRGGASLVGQSLLNCHSPASADAINRVLNWFAASAGHNRIFTYKNVKENKDVYMIALRDDSGQLIGYYEKHEYRSPETARPYGLLD